MPGDSCQECAYLVGHAATCSMAKLDPETAGWNAGLEAAAADVGSMIAQWQRVKQSPIYAATTVGEYVGALIRELKK